MWRTASPVTLSHNETPSLLPKNLTAGSSFYAYCRHGQCMIVHIESGIVSQIPSHIPSEQMTQVIITEIELDEVAIILSTNGIEFWKLFPIGSAPMLLSFLSIEDIIPSNNKNSKSTQNDDISAESKHMDEKDRNDLEYLYLRGIAIMEASDSPTGNYAACVGCSNGDVVVIDNIGNNNREKPKIFRTFINIEKESNHQNIYNHDISSITDIVITDYKSLIACSNDQGLIILYNLKSDPLTINDEIYTKFQIPTSLPFDMVPDKFTPEPLPESCPCQCLAARGINLIAGYLNGSVR